MSKRCLLAAVLMLPWLAFAQMQTAAGVWKTFGDRGGEAESLVHISEHNGEFEGRVLAVFAPPAADSKPRCELCAGDLKNQPVVGMRVLTGLRREGNH